MMVSNSTKEDFSADFSSIDAFMEERPNEEFSFFWNCRLSEVLIHHLVPLIYVVNYIFYAGNGEVPICIKSPDMRILATS